MIKQNLHTHSTYCDGNDTIEEMVETAIAKNFKVLGFSGHGPFENDECAIPMGKLADYIAEVKRVKEKYASKIKIYLGIEEDVLGIKFNHDTFDYIIGSVHKVYDGNIYQTIDYRKDVTNKIIIDGYNGNFLEFAKSYFNEMEKLIDDPEIDIIGHFDLIQKYNLRKREELAQEEYEKVLELAALSTSYYYLAKRDYSKKELYYKLLEKYRERKIVNSVIKIFEEKGHLDD